MLTALQTLLDENVLNADEFNTLLGKAIDKVDLDDNRALVLLAWLRVNESNNYEPDDIVNADDNTFDVGSFQYRVLDEEEANGVCCNYIEETLWAFTPSFLSYMTNLPEEVFQFLSEKCEDANDPILRIVKSTCGIDKLVNEAICADGRGHFIASYDGEENEFVGGGRYFYIYRVN